MLEQYVEEYKTWIIELRRHFHSHPELSGQEFETQRKVLQELAKLHLTPRKAAGTGVIADIEGRNPGPIVAIRADMDALQLTDQCGKPYQSQNPGACHACGHDGHMAMLLGVAKVLCSIKEQLNGTIRLIFQPSEEKFPGGAVSLIKEGCLRDVNFIIGAHLWQPLSIGTIGISYGPLLASPDQFTITVQGRGGHGSMPHQTIDPIVVASHLVTAYHTIISRQIDPLCTSVLSLGRFHAGQVYNVIPDQAILEGTVRTFDPVIRNQIFSSLEQLTKGICHSYGATYTLCKHYGFPPVVNVPKVSEVIAQYGTEVLGKDKVIETKPFMVGEDFSHYLEHVPGAFFLIGIANKEQGIDYPHHHPQFDMDESALPMGVHIMAKAALKLLALTNKELSS